MRGVLLSGPGHTGFHLLGPSSQFSLTRSSFLPNRSSKGENPVETRGNFRHREQQREQPFVRSFTIGNEFTDHEVSFRPSDCGWYTLVRTDFIPHNLNSSLTYMKVVLWLVGISFGTLIWGMT